jgi:Protein of unknown function (DUF1496)
MVSRWIGLLAVLACLGPASATPEPKASTSPACLYASKAYSEGAFVCAQKSMMLTCVADGGHVSWKVVADKEINDRCTAPVVQHYSPAPRPHRRRIAVNRFRPVVPAKCFVFNGREYCE